MTRGLTCPTLYKDVLPPLSERPKASPPLSVGHVHSSICHDISFSLDEHPQSSLRRVRRSPLFHCWAGTSHLCFPESDEALSTTLPPPPSLCPPPTHTHRCGGMCHPSHLSLDLHCFPFFPAKVLFPRMTGLNNHNQLFLSQHFCLCCLHVRPSPSLLPECEEGPSPLRQLQGSQASL